MSCISLPLSCIFSCPSYTLHRMNPSPSQSSQRNTSSPCPACTSHHLAMAPPPPSPTRWHWWSGELEGWTPLIWFICIFICEDRGLLRLTATLPVAALNQMWHMCPLFFQVSGKYLHRLMYAWMTDKHVWIDACKLSCPYMHKVCCHASMDKNQASFPLSHTTRIYSGESTFLLQIS